MSTPKDAEELYRSPEDVAAPDPTAAFLDKPVKTNDPKALKDKAVSDKVLELRIENAIRGLLATDGGADLMAHIIGHMCGCHFPGFSANPHIRDEMFGRRSIGWQLEQMIRDIDFDLWVRVDRALEQRRQRPKSQVQRTKER